MFADLRVNAYVRYLQNLFMSIMWIEERVMLTPPHGEPSPAVSCSVSPQVSPNSLSPLVDVTEDTVSRVFVCWWIMFHIQSTCMMYNFLQGFDFVNLWVSLSNCCHVSTAECGKLTIIINIYYCPTKTSAIKWINNCYD